LEGVHLPPPYESGCLNDSNGTAMYWPIFLPAFIIQTVLFLFTIARVLRPMRLGTNKSLSHRLLRDGGFFYLVVCLSVGFTGIGSVELNHPLVAIPALISNSILAIHSICASHLILSIHSLASDMGSDPTFLLSNIEFSRVAWRRGSNANELVVDVDRDAAGDEYDDGLATPGSFAGEGLPLELIDLHPLSSNRSGTLQKPKKPTASRVGVYSARPGQTELGFRAYAY